MKLMMIAGPILVAPPLSLEVRQVVGSGSCHNFNRCYDGSALFVSVKKKYNNRLHTNKNCRVVQNSTNSAHNIILI